MCESLKASEPVTRIALSFLTMTNKGRPIGTGIPSLSMRERA
nr:MAG TPA: hypothetical protein [Caudoviricetes sp.]